MTTLLCFVFEILSYQDCLNARLSVKVWNLELGSEFVFCGISGKTLHFSHTLIQ